MIEISFHTVLVFVLCSIRVGFFTHSTHDRLNEVMTLAPLTENDGRDCEPLPA